MARSIVRILGLIAGGGILCAAAARGEPAQKLIGNPEGVTDPAGITKPADAQPKPDPKPAKNPQQNVEKNPVLAAAIAALSEEYTNAIDAGETPLSDAQAKLVAKAKAKNKVKKSASAPAANFRVTSDYFIKNPTSDVLPDAVLGVIEKPAKGDNREIAYVRWQLLSAVLDKFDAKLTNRALKAYNIAPQPIPHLGPQEQSKLDAITHGVKEDDELLVRKKYQDAQDDIDASNVFILNYRTTLYQKLPVSFNTILAGYEDVYNRAHAGVSVEDFVPVVNETAKLWLNRPEAKPSEVQQINELVSRLVKAPIPPYAGNPTWSKSSSSYIFTPATVTLNPKNAMTEMQKFLSDKMSAANATAGNAKKVKKHQ